MLWVTFLRTSGGIMWAVGRSLFWDELDGWLLNGFRADSQGHPAGGSLHAPPDWRLVEAFEVPDEDYPLEETEE